MSNPFFSFVIPVFNRPQEIENLLQSIGELSYDHPFEVVIVEDGSQVLCKEVCDRFRESESFQSKGIRLNYFFKSNSGPGDSRNYGMRKAQGDYYIILDSDCLLPATYLSAVADYLSNHEVDCFGGPDAAHDRFTDLQKAINYAMTSFFTTGGIRGGSERLGKFQPRSFNMGMSKEVFERTKGFGTIHPGEDPDLTIRIWKEGFHTHLIKEAFVFHERRISWELFYRQVRKFGMVRVILNKWHPNTKKITYWFPTLFIVSTIIAVVFACLGWFFIGGLILGYFVLIFMDSTIKNGLKVGGMSVYAAGIQLLGYGTGFLKSWWNIAVLNKNERDAFPKLFFS
jgi:glycosyltransferase involved in cell wall biosynthesis